MEYSSCLVILNTILAINNIWNYKLSPIDDMVSLSSNSLKVYLSSKEEDSAGSVWEKGPFVQIDQKIAYL